LASTIEIFSTKFIVQPLIPLIEFQSIFKGIFIPLNILFISIATMIPGMITGLLAWNQLTKFTRLLVIQLGMGILANILASCMNGPNGDIFNYYMVTDFTLVFLAAVNFIPKKFRLYFVCLGFGGFFAIWISSLIIGTQGFIASVALIYACFVLAIEYFFGMVEMFFEKDFIPGLFILFLITFIYYCGIIPIFSFLHYLQIHEIRRTQWVFNTTIGVLSAIRYLTVAIGFYVIRAQKKELYYAPE